MQHTVILMLVYIKQISLYKKGIYMYCWHVPVVLREGKYAAT